MATVPSEITWVAGQVVTAAQLNSNLRDAVNFIISPPLALLRQSVVQSVGNNVWVSITLDVEDIDRDNGHSTSTNTSRYTAQTQGYYSVQGTVVFAQNGTGGRGVRLSVTGVATVGRATSSMAASNLVHGQEISGPVFLNVGDYVEVQGVQISGGALNTFAGSDFASAMAVRWTSTP